MKNIIYLSLSVLVMNLLSSSAFALNPSLVYKQTPEKYNMVFDEHTVATADGYNLKAWYFPANVKTTQLILISHNGEGNMADYLRLVDQFVSTGNNVMIYDYRGFGQSSEFGIDNNMYIYPHFQDDIIAMINYCRDKITPNFSLYGWGIGAGLSLGIGYHRTEVKKIIADSPFLSMEDLEKRFSSWDTPMEVPFAGYDKKYEPIFTLDLEPSKSLEKIMLIIGSNDLLFKVDDMKTLQDKKKKLITLQEITNPDRTNNFTADAATYYSAIEKFLKK